MIPASVRVHHARVVVIHTVAHDFIEDDSACSTDLAMTTSVVRLPAAVDDSRALLVQMDGTTARLAAHPT